MALKYGRRDCAGSIAIFPAGNMRNPEWFGDNVIPILITSLFAFILYLFLTSGSGTDIMGMWSYGETVAGIIVAGITGLISGRFFCRSKNYRMANPLRWIMLVIYIIPFFIEMARANLDVASRVITGNIRPGIVRISPGLKSNLGITLLANSITLTPGTLTVDIDEKSGDLFIHMINLPKGSEEKEIVDVKELFSFFNLSEWIRRIAE